MPYHASQTVQITTVDGKNPAEAVHEMRADGTALCNIPLRPLKGQPAMFAQRGPGDVTCGNCERMRPES